MIKIKVSIRKCAKIYLFNDFTSAHSDGMILFHWQLWLSPTTLSNNDRVRAIESCCIGDKFDVLLIYSSNNTPPTDLHLSRWIDLCEKWIHWKSEKRSRPKAKHNLTWIDTDSSLALAFKWHLLYEHTVTNFHLCYSFSKEFISFFCCPFFLSLFIMCSNIYFIYLLLLFYTVLPCLI